METTVLDYDPEEDRNEFRTEEINDNQTCSYNGCELLEAFLDDGVADNNSDPELLLKGIQDRKIRILDIEVEILRLKEKIELLEALNSHKETIRKKLITEINDRWLKRQITT